MADVDLEMSFKLAPSLLEQLSKALIELDAHKHNAADKVSFSEISDHFRDLETQMMKKYTELEAKEKAFKQEESETRTLLAAKETAVAAKEQDMFDRIQILKDAAVAAIAETRANYPPPRIFTDDDSTLSSDNKVTCSLDETKLEPSNKTGDGEVTFLQELTDFCEQMDTKGLMAFITENQEHINVLCEELSHALECSTEPSRLILDSLEGFYPPDDINNNNSNSNSNSNNNKDMRQSCICLMQAMNAMLARASMGPDRFLNYESKQQAKAIADEWMLKLGNKGIVDASNERSLEVEAFLQLLASFRIASQFDEDELCKLVVAVCEQRQAPELWRSLGISHKMPGVIEDLISEGKLVSAVHLVHAFGLVDKFPTVPLLMTYLKDLRRNSQGKRGNAPNSESVQNDGNVKELAALRTVIYCVQKYDLESDYPLDSLHKRVVQLERAKGDKKRIRESSNKREPTIKREPTFRHESASKRPHHKKPRPNGGGVYGGRHSPAATYMAVNGRQPPAPAPAPVYMDRGLYAAPPPERYPHVDPYHYQPAHHHPPPTSQTMYSQQVYEQSAYYYPPDDRAAAAAAVPPPAYGGYTSGVPSSYQPYM